MIFKKSIAILLVCTMLLPLSACGKGNEENETGSEEVAVVESTDPEEMAKEAVDEYVEKNLLGGPDLLFCYGCLCTENLRQQG